MGLSYIYLYESEDIKNMNRYKIGIIEYTTKFVKAYKIQENGKDTVEANIELGFQADHRDYGVGAQILRAMQVSKIRLLSNNPKKRVGLLAYGIEIVESVALEIVSNEHNKFYLQTKRDKLGHSFKNLNE